MIIDYNLTKSVMFLLQQIMETVSTPSFFLSMSLYHITYSRQN